MSLLAVERGVQLPSFEVVPDGSGDDGEQAVALAGGYGLVADPWQAATVDAWLRRRPDGQWACPRCGLVVPRQNGKNAVLEIRELFGMIALGERILHTAHEVKTARKAFLRLCSFFENDREYPELAALVREIRKTNGQEAIVLIGGGSVEFIARSKSSGRGFSVDVLVLDEVQEASEEALAALLPTISASPNPQLIVTGTPPGPKANGEVFTRVRQAAHDGIDRGLCWREWACEPGANPNDIAELSKANPSLGLRLLLETIEGERATMDPAEFARERMGVWDPAEQGRGPFDMARWRNLNVGKGDARPNPVALAVTVSIDRQWAHIGLAGMRPDGKRHLQIVQSGRGTGWVAEKAAELAKTHSAVVAVDPGGPAGALLQPLAEAGVEPHLVTGRELGQAVGLLLDGYEQSTVAHGSQPELDMAVEHARLRPVGTSQVWDHRTEIDPAPVWAVTLALWALQGAEPKKKRSGLVVGLR